MRKLATIAQIKSFSPIPGADRIQLAQLVDREWEVIVTKDYQVAQIGVYFEPDSFLPELPEYEDLRARCFKKLDGRGGFRLRTIKMRGVYSQGFFLPMDKLPTPVQGSLHDG